MPATEGSVQGGGRRTVEPLIDGIAEFPAGSCAPFVVAQIYRMDMSAEGKRALASMFLAAYRSMAE